MKRIFISIAGAIAFFLLGMLVAYYVYQHLKNPSFSSSLPISITLDNDSTNLPIVVINTDGQLKSIRKDKKIPVYIRVIDDLNGINYFDSQKWDSNNTAYDGWALIKLRGNTTQYVDKKSFSIKLTNGPNGAKEKASLLGMEEADDWCLLAEHRDGTLIRDALTYELAKDFFDYVPEARYCELIIDGKYMGIYLMGEKITKGKLGLKKDDDPELTGGFLLEIDHEDEVSFRSKYPARKKDIVIGEKGMPVSILFPKQQDLTSEQKQHIINDFECLEDAIEHGDFATYSRILDVQSFASYQLIQELSNNIDGYYFSHKVYRENGVGGLYKMTIWDFDIAYGSSAADMGMYVDNWMYESRPCVFWWWKLAQDREYQEVLRERWSLMRKEVYSTENIMNRIDSILTLLMSYGAINRNTKAWQLWEGKSFKAGQRTGNSYESEVEYLKNWILLRLNYLDNKILGLQYNVEQCDSASINLSKIGFYYNKQE